MRSERIIRGLLRLYPATFRRRYGAAMLEFHRDRVRDGVTIAGWARIIADHLTAALSERLRSSESRLHSTGGASLATLAQDATYALRVLARRPVFTIAVVATIALGVGANAAIFSVVHGILLRPLPYPHPERVVSFGHEPPQWLASEPEYFDYKLGLRSFEALSAFIQNEGNLATEEEPERISLASVTRDFFSVLGLSPMLGRSFGSDEDLSSPATVMIISHGLWQRRFGGDPALVGKPITLNGRPRTVIGIMPRNFDYPQARTDAWLPLARMNADSLGHRSNHFLFMVGRLRPGVTVEQARGEARVFASRMMADQRNSYDPKFPPIPNITKVSEGLVGATRPYLWALLGAVGFVLLIVCANVANLLLARGEGRRTEMALRSALGASRHRLITQLLAEALVLAFTGGLLGVGIAWAADRVLMAIAPSSIPRLDEIGIDWAVVAYAFATSLVAGLLFGIVPAFRASREAPAETLKKSGRSEQRVGSRRVRKSLVVAEVALAVVMLSGAGMLLRSLLNLQRADLGFDSRSALTVKVSPLQSSYDEAKSIVFYDQLLERVRAIPGVQYAGAAGWLPVTGAGGLWGVLAEGQSYERMVQGPTGVPQQVTPGYFDAIGIRLVSGRDFSDQDRETGPYVGIVSQAMAEQLWPNANPLGKRFRLGGAETYMTVVGVVNDIRSRGFTDTPEPTMYFPYPQTARSAYVMPRSLSLIIRTSGDPLLIASQVRSIVRSLDPAVPVSDIRTLEQVVGTSVANRRFSTGLIAAFAGLALVLAGIGIFGVISYGVSERRFEIGVRMALGAERGKALALVVGDSLRMALLGIALGLFGAAATARVIRSMLVGVSTVDMPTLLAVSGLLIVVVIVATILPALRAMSVDPTDALRG
ncbi:MAG: ABC transporter permease [Gemmatimonadota bacterium]